MKRMVALRLLAGLPLATFAALLLLAGCAKRETPVEASVRTKTLLIGNGAEPASLDPHVAVMYYDQRIVQALFEGLTAIDGKTALPVPAVAESWDVSSDGLVYTFHLRPNARWSNGDPLTAHDFAFAFQRILLPKLGVSYCYMLWPIKNAEAFNAGKLADFSAVGVEAVDTVTLRLTLERPTPYLPVLVTHNTWMPLHRETLEKFRAVDDRNAAWTRPGALVGNGPFMLAEWRPNNRIIVTRNPYYWDNGHNRLERVVFFPTESPEVEEHGFRAGQMHITNSLPMAKIAVYRARDPAKLRIEPLLATYYLDFNVGRPPLDRVKVRRALALAIDRESIVRAVFAGSRLPAVCLIPPGCAGYIARARVPTDFAAARRLLAEAGFPGGKGLPEMAVRLGINVSEWTRVVEVIQETWRRELGVRITLEPLESKTWLQYMQSHDYAISFSGWIADFADPATFLEVHVTNGGNNWTGWSNPGYDRLIADASCTLDQGRRFEMFQQAETLLLEEAPIAPIYSDAQTYLIHPSVKNWEPSVLGLHWYQRVWLEP